MKRFLILSLAVVLVVTTLWIMSASAAPVEEYRTETIYGQVVYYGLSCGVPNLPRTNDLVYIVSYDNGHQDVFFGELPKFVSTGDWVVIRYLYDSRGYLVDTWFVNKK